MSILKRIDVIDKKVSTQIFKLKLPLVLEAYLLFWGTLFNKEGPLLILFLISFVLQGYSSKEQELFGLYYGA